MLLKVYIHCTFIISCFYQVLCLSGHNILWYYNKTLVKPKNTSVSIPLKIILTNNNNDQNNICGISYTMIPCYYETVIFSEIIWWESHRLATLKLKGRKVFSFCQSIITNFSEYILHGHPKWRYCSPKGGSINSNSSTGIKTDMNQMYVWKLLKNKPSHHLTLSIATRLDPSIQGLPDSQK